MSLSLLERLKNTLTEGDGVKILAGKEKKRLAFAVPENDLTGIVAKETQDLSRLESLVAENPLSAKAGPQDPLLGEIDMSRGVGKRDWTPQENLETKSMTEGELTVVKDLSQKVQTEEEIRRELFGDIDFDKRIAHPVRAEESQQKDLVSKSKTEGEMTVTEDDDLEERFLGDIEPNDRFVGRLDPHDMTDRLSGSTSDQPVAVKIPEIDGDMAGENTVAISQEVADFYDKYFSDNEEYQEERTQDLYMKAA